MAVRFEVWAGALLLTACASGPLVQTASFEPGIPAGQPSYQLVDGGDSASRAIRPHVEARLRGFGFVESESPQLLISVSRVDRDRSVGAYLPSCSESPQWAAAPVKRRVFQGRLVHELHVTISDARSGRLLYRSSAMTRDADKAAALAAAALREDPRRAPIKALPDCTPASG